MTVNDEAKSDRKKAQRRWLSVGSSSGGGSGLEPPHLLQAQTQTRSLLMSSSPRSASAKPVNIDYGSLMPGGQEEAPGDVARSEKKRRNSRDGGWVTFPLKHALLDEVDDERRDEICETRW